MQRESTKSYKLQKNTYLCLCSLWKYNIEILGQTIKTHLVFLSEKDQIQVSIFTSIHSLTV